MGLRGAAAASAVAVLLAAVLCAVPASASASTSRSLDPLSETTQTPMLADCSSITDRAREYARLHAIGLCGADTTAPDLPLRTENVGGEECGAVTLTMTSRGGGLATIGWRVSSEVGPVLDVELDVAFSGRAGGQMRRFAEREPVLGATGSAVAFLGSGRAAATVSGTVETFTARCRIAPSSVRVHLR